MLGDSWELAVALVRRLRDSGVAAHSALSLTDSEASALLAEDRWGAVAVVTREDVLALRLGLLSAHVRPDLPLCVTMFDKTIMRELQHVAPVVHALSPSQLAAPPLAERCLAAAGRICSRAQAGIGIVDDALLLLVRAGLGLIATFVVETTIALIALHDGLVDAAYFATRSVATVAGVPGAVSAPTWFKAISAIDTIAALLLVAVFTAALVRRLSRARLTTLLGSLAAPARGHVLLIGFGQVGFRLAQELRGRGYAVLGVERDPDAPCVRLARSAGIPVAIGRGDDRTTLEKAGIRRCAAVAAMTSSDLVNVAVGLAARDLVPEVPLVLRLGDGEVAAETDSLLHLGEICDVHGIAADELASTLQALAEEGGQAVSAPTSG